MTNTTAKSADDLMSEASSLMENAYRNHVHFIASEVIDLARDQYNAGTDEESLREWLSERIWEMIDGDAWVIYTFKAKCVLICSDNAEAYSDQFGDISTEDGMFWSKMAFAALYQDVIEQLDSEGFEVNDPTTFFDTDD